VARAAFPFAPFVHLLLRRVGLSPQGAALVCSEAVRDGELDADKFWTLLARLRGIDDPLLGFRTATQLPERGVDFLERVLRCGQTLRAGIGHASALHGSLLRSMRLELQEGATTATLRYCGPHGGRHEAEFALTMCVMVGRRFAPIGTGHLLEVRFRHDRPVSDEAYLYEEFFRCPVLHGGADNALVVRRVVLDVHPSSSHTPLQRFVSRHVTGSVDATILRLADVYAGAARSTRSGIEHVADQLGVGARTLQRRLRAAHLTHTDLLEQARLESAWSLILDTDMTVVDIAKRLRFAEASSFRRAFLRWTGTTPGAVRNATNAA
jgi:AraC-like DNA-binding protein